VSNYKCGRCFRTYDDLQAFGAHPCAGENPMLAALGGVIALPEFTIDLARTVDEHIELQNIKNAVDRLEDGLRQGDL